MSKLRGAAAKAAGPMPPPNVQTLTPAQHTALRHYKKPPPQPVGGTGVIGDYYQAEETKRVRSFVERYLIERAALFRAGHESEDAWKAILDGKRMYQQVKLAAKQQNTEDSNGEL